MIDLLLLGLLLYLTKLLLDLLVPVDVFADDFGVDFESESRLLARFVQETVDEDEYKTLHVLLLHFPLQTLLDELVFCSLLDIHQ